MWRLVRDDEARQQTEANRAARAAMGITAEQEAQWLRDQDEEQDTAWRPTPYTCPRCGWSTRSLEHENHLCPEVDQD